MSSHYKDINKIANMTALDLLSLRDSRASFLYKLSREVPFITPGAIKKFRKKYVCIV